MKNRPARPQIGLISDSCIESYNAKIWDGVMEGVDECGADLYCFMGGALRPPEFSWKTTDEMAVHSVVKVLRSSD